MLQKILKLTRCHAQNFHQINLLNNAYFQNKVKLLLIKAIDLN